MIEKLLIYRFIVWKNYWWNEWMNEFDIAKGCYTNTVDQIENCSNTAESRWDQVSNFE